MRVFCGSIQIGNWLQVIWTEKIALQPPTDIDEQYEINEHGRPVRSDLPLRQE